jgi:hypothetical protein
VSQQQQQLLEEAKAWRKVAKRINSRGIMYGFCADLYGNERTAKGLGVDLTTRMQQRVEEHMSLLIADGADYYHNWANYFDKPGARKSRVMAALFLAAEAESEATA